MKLKLANRAALAAALAMTFASCGQLESVDSGFRLVGVAATPVERQIIVNHKDISAINASIGDEPIQFVTTRPLLLGGFAKKIARRWENDFLNIYKENPTKADATYLLLGSRNEGYVVFVVRVVNRSPNGSYVPLKGLVYQFASTESEPEQVGPTDF